MPELALAFFFAMKRPSAVIMALATLEPAVLPVAGRSVATPGPVLVMQLVCQSPAIVADKAGAMGSIQAQAR